MANVTPKGKSGWSQLREARGFKGSEENKKYSQDLILNKHDGEAFVNLLQVEANKLHAQEIEKAKLRGKTVRYAPPIINYKDLPGGQIQLSFKRNEEDGKPMVIDVHKQPYTGSITRNHTIEIAYEMRPYVMASVFGVTLRLIAVRVLDAEMTVESVADLFGDASPATKSAPAESIEDLF